MKNILYISNFPKDVTEEEISQLLTPIGEIARLQIFWDEKINCPYALVEMVKEKDATKARNSLNGTIIRGYYLAVVPYAVDVRDKLNAKQQAILEMIANALGEKDEVPMRQLRTLIMLCGTNFAEALLKETEEIEAREGIMTSDGARRRTKGGVFFYLARYRMPRTIRSIIYNRKGRMPLTDNDISVEARTS